MKDEASIVEQYADSDVGERIAILIRYYPNFIRNDPILFSEGRPRLQDRR